MIRLEKEVRLGVSGGGRALVSVVREHYLRDDIPCKSRACALCGGQEEGASWLSVSASHYAIPDCGSLRDYLEVFEHPSLSSTILLQTTTSHLRMKAGRHSYSRVRRLLGSVHKECVLFSNEHHLETFLPRQPGEGGEEWGRRLVFRAGVWYANHLQASGKTIPIIIISEEPELYSQYDGGDTEGLSVMAIADYLVSFWPEQSELHALCDSLSASLALTREEGGRGREYSDHLSMEAIAEGLIRGDLFQGTLQVSRYHPREEAFLSPHSTYPGREGAGLGDILIHGAASRNRALHGDTVAVRLLPRSEWRGRSNTLPHTPGEGGGREGGGGSTDSAMPTGVVVGILQRTSREYVASFAEVGEGGSKRVLVYPYDIRIPKIRISTRQAQQLRNHRIVVRIDSWEADSQYPNGHFVRSIGPVGDIETETAAILIEQGLAATPFSKALLDELPADSEDQPWEVEEGEVGRRRDLRHTHLVFSIDPRGCEDVDDTLSIRHLKHGVTELGVHIADVSYFVQPGSLTDKEAQERSTTVYLADRRYDMLPPILSADLCSLLSNVDRYAVSVVWRLDSSFQVKEVWYGRTVIRSAYKMAYETAQALYDGAGVEEVVGDLPELSQQSLSREQLQEKVEELRSAISSLVDIARVLRHRRAQGGALELEGVEVRVQLSDTDKTEIEDLIPKQPLEMHETIAECMIFANHWIAKKLLSTLPTHTLLRRHPPPSQDRFASLRGCAEAKGFSLHTNSNKALAESLDACVDSRDPSVNKILRTLATQAMVQAEYFSTGSLPPDQFSHYGLALDLYTHFTSPIRRYADLVVHRQLLATVGEDEEESLPSNTRLSELTQHMNSKHRAAQISQISSTELFQSLYFSSREDSRRCEVNGVVYALRANGLMCFAPRYGIKGPVYLKDKNGQVAQPHPSNKEDVIFAAGSLERDSHHITVTYPTGSYMLRLFDHVRVRVSVEHSHAHAPSLLLRLLSCEPIPPEEEGEGGTSRKELVQTVTVESAIAQSEEEGLLSSEHYRRYRQSDPGRSVYCLVQHMYRLSLLDDV